MSSGQLSALRQEYHRRIVRDVLRLKDGVPNNADRGSKSSIAISRGIVEEIGGEVRTEALSGQPPAIALKLQQRIS